MPYASRVGLTHNQESPLSVRAKALVFIAQTSANNIAAQQKRPSGVPPPHVAVSRYSQSGSAIRVRRCFAKALEPGVGCTVHGGGTLRLSAMPRISQQTIRTLESVAMVETVGFWKRRHHLHKSFAPYVYSRRSKTLQRPERLDLAGRRNCSLWQPPPIAVTSQSHALL